MLQKTFWKATPFLVFCPWVDTWTTNHFLDLFPNTIPYSQSVLHYYNLFGLSVTTSLILAILPYFKILALLHINSGLYCAIWST